MIDTIISESFKKNGSVKATRAETGYSWNRIVKSLSSNGIIINDNHRKILELKEIGWDANKIAHQLGLSVNTVKSYLPRTRPVYGENQSANAKEIKKWREKKK